MCPAYTGGMTTTRVISNDIIPTFGSDMDFRIKLFAKRGKNIIPALSSKIITTNVFLQNPDKFNMWIIQDCVHPGLSLRTSGFIQPGGAHSHGELKLKLFNNCDKDIQLGNLHLATLLCTPFYNCD